MNVTNAVLVLMWLGVTAYAVLGGADFGAGFWDLIAGNSRKASNQRRLIEHSIGPVWEANHVWLIFALVVLWTGFPRAFAAVASTLYLPLTAAAVGVILRGSAFAFRKAVTTFQLRRLFGATFAASSVITPFFLGAAAGGVASGRVPAGNAAGNTITSWVNPTSILGGTLAVVTCAYLAAAYLTADASRQRESALAEEFRLRALVMAVISGLVATVGITILRSDAPRLFDGLTGRAMPLIVVSAIGGLGSVALLWLRRFEAARVFAALAVTAVIWGWGVGQYPDLLSGSLSIEDAAAAQPTMVALFITLLVGGAITAPALVFLFLLTQRGKLGVNEDAVFSADE